MRYIRRNWLLSLYILLPTCPVTKVGALFLLYPLHSVCTPPCLVHFHHCPLSLTVSPCMSPLYICCSYESPGRPLPATAKGACPPSDTEHIAVDAMVMFLPPLFLGECGISLLLLTMSMCSCWATHGRDSVLLEWVWDSHTLEFTWLLSTHLRIVKVIELPWISVSSYV